MANDSPAAPNRSLCTLPTAKSPPLKVAQSGGVMWPGSCAGGFSAGGLRLSGVPWWGRWRTWTRASPGAARLAGVPGDRSAEIRRSALLILGRVTGWNARLISGVPRPEPAGLSHGEVLPHSRACRFARPASPPVRAPGRRTGCASASGTPPARRSGTDPREDLKDAARRLPFGWQQGRSCFGTARASTGPTGWTIAVPWKLTAVGGMGKSSDNRPPRRTGTVTAHPSAGRDMTGLPAIRGDGHI